MKLVSILCWFYIGLGFVFAQTQDLNNQNLESYTDSLYYSQTGYYTTEDFKNELNLRDKVLSSYSDTFSTHYKLSLAKKLASEASYQNYKMEYDKAIELSKKSIDLYNNSGIKNLIFLGHLNKKLYEQYWSKQEWDRILNLTHKTLDIFKDTLSENHKIVAEVEFDIGKVLNKFGDYSNVIDQYKKAIEISVAYEGENNADAAYYEHNLALVYGFMGYYRKELESYKNVISRWESTDYHDMSYLAVAYGSLSTWYLQHGDFTTAEKYLIKKENLAKKHKNELNNWYNETFLGRTKVETWHNYADLYVFKKDTVKARMYNRKVLDYLTNYDLNDSKNNPHNLSYFKNFVYLSIYFALKFEADLLKKTEPDKAKELYEQAYNTILKSSSNVSTLTNRLGLIESHIDLKNYDTATKILNEEKSEAIENERFYDLIQLYAIEANLAAEFNDYSSMDSMYSLLFNNFQLDSEREITIQNLKAEDCKPYGNNEIVEIILNAAHNYEEAFIETKETSFLRKAHNLNVLTSNIFSENFSFLVYNDQTYATASVLNEQLLSTTLRINDKDEFERVLENIEQTQSRLSWKKFISSRQRKNLNIPDSILEKESNLNAELQFYKKSLFVGNEKNEVKREQYKEKIFDLEKQIESLEKWFQKEYHSYANQVLRKFDLSEIKDKLKRSEKIIKYVFTNESVYSFLISDHTNTTL